MARQLFFPFVLFLALVACARPLPTLVPQLVSSSSLAILDTDAQDVAWSRDGKILAYAKRASDGYLDIWTSQPDGRDKRCLTCNRNFSRRNRVGIAPRPQNDFIAFVAANDDVRDAVIPDLAHPSTALNSNLWAMQADGSQVWKLTDLPTDSRAPRAMGHPRFSRDGKQLAWTESLGKTDSSRQLAWGEWTITIADFVVENNAPKIKNIVRAQLGEQHAFIAVNDWSRDGRAILLSGNLSHGQSVNGLDIFEYTIATGELEQLTDSRDDWDADAHYTPDEKMIAWISSADLRVAISDVRAWQNDLRTELWTMERDGSNQQRVTFFNQPGTADYDWFQNNVAKATRVTVANSASSPDGKKIVLTLAYPDSSQKIHTLLVALDLTQREQNPAGASATTVPREYQSLAAELNARLDEFAARLDAQPRIAATPLVLAAELLPAHSSRGDDLLTNRTYQNALAYLDALQTLGARGVQITIGYPVLSVEFARTREYAAFYKRLAQEIRRRKMTLLVNASLPRADYRPPSLEKYKQVKREHIAAIVREIQPDYLTLANEPATEAKITGLSIPLTSFIEHINFILGIVDHRNVWIGAGTGNGDDPAYIQALAKIPSVDYIDIHINAANRDGLTRLLEFAETARANNKHIVIGEAWLAKTGAPDAFAFWQTLDAKFINVSAQFARQNRIEFLAFAQPNYFFAYLDYDTTRPNLAQPDLAQLTDLAASQQMRAGKITATGLAFQKLATSK
ncbi:MAG: PD40 domain-containing protein [Chloroflexi bacterium]|nr:PD40 domain-containing protein [Chloroflexota bacterium]